MDNLAEPSASQSLLAHSLAGSGSSVLFLHGLASNRRIWAPQVDRLSATHRVLTVDLPGHGDSSARADLDLERVAAEIAALVRSCKLGRVVLVGHSLGGTLAAWLAHALGADAKGLIVIDSSMASMRVPPEMRAHFRQMMAADHDGALRQVLGPAASSTAQLDRIIEDARIVSVDTYVGYLDALAAKDVSSRNGELRIPVHAMMSRLLVPRFDRAALDAFGFADLADLTWTGFPDAHHYLFWDEPEGFAQDLEATLNRFERS